MLTRRAVCMYALFFHCTAALSEGINAINDVIYHLETLAHSTRES